MSNWYSNRFKPLEGLSCGSYISGIQKGGVNDRLSRMGGRKVSASQGSYRVTTGQSWHLDESGPSEIEGMIYMQVVSMVEILEMDQSRSIRVIEIGGSSCCRVVIE